MTTLEPSRCHEDDGLRGVVILALFFGSLLAWVAIVGGVWLLWRWLGVERLVAGALLVAGLWVMGLTWYELERMP